EFIKETSKKYSENFKVVSFGGGKDSVAVSFLVKKALRDIPLFFADTTLEYPETYEFIERFAHKYDFELVRDDNGNFYRSDQDFFELCKKLGPPSIRYRWCCYVFKAYSVNKFYENLFIEVKVSEPNGYPPRRYASYALSSFLMLRGVFSIIPANLRVLFLGLNVITFSLISTSGSPSIPAFRSSSFEIRIPFFTVSMTSPSLYLEP
ncbi:MAG: phosphoadenosine phosphosulfate reductase family protein, partial [Euryarchaeota archaeon]|nr:phosphoadenosine phosphosulfate reductase family protein [Euryarchaeota archaeon]